MAVLAGGKLLLEGAPAKLMADLEGRIWTKTVDRGDLEAARAEHEVISTRLSAGRTVIHVLAEKAPDPEFVSVPGGLEDVYFSSLAASRRAA